MQGWASSRRPSDRTNRVRCAQSRCALPRTPRQTWRRCCARRGGWTSASSSRRLARPSAPRCWRLACASAEPAARTRTSRSLGLPGHARIHVGCVTAVVTCALAWARCKALATVSDSRTVLFLSSGAEDAHAGCHVVAGSHAASARRCERQAGPSLRRQAVAAEAEGYDAGDLGLVVDRALHAALRGQLALAPGSTTPKMGTRQT